MRTRPQFGDRLHPLHSGRNLVFGVGLTMLALGGCGELAGLTQMGQLGNLTTISEEGDRELFGQRIRRILKSERFDRLEQFADSLQAGGLTWPGGMSYVLAFYRHGFGTVNDPSSPEQWARHLELLRRWEESRQESMAARIALANALIGRGWTARGHAIAALVPAERMQRFLDDLGEAQAILRQCPAKARDCPAWHDAAMRALHGLGSGADAEYHEVYAQAIARYPTMPRWYIGMAQHVMPIWYGAPGDLERFADTCATALPDSSRDEIYARIAADQCEVVREVFRRYPGYSWRRVQRGLDIWERRSPASLDALSARARLAYYAGDRAVARKAFQQLGNRVDMDVWVDELFFLSARKWAFTKGPPPRSS